MKVLPLRVDDVDRKAAGRDIAWTPVVGVVLGAFVVGVLHLLAISNISALVAGFLFVGVVALSTRGMHLDGLADVADVLVCYSPPERALNVINDGGAFPFWFVSLIEPSSLTCARMNSMGRVMKAPSFSAYLRWLSR